MSDGNTTAAGGPQMDAKQQEVHDRIEKATHIILWWNIHWLILAFPLLYWAPESSTIPKWVLFVMLCLTIIVSDLHWRDVQYGGIRHALDGLVVTITLILHLVYLGGLPYAAVNIGIILGTLFASTSIYVLGWYAHTYWADVVLGMWCHVVFRFFGAISIVFAICQGFRYCPLGFFNDQDSGACYGVLVSYVFLLFAMYFIHSIVLWRYVRPAESVKWYLGPPEEEAVQDNKADDSRV